MRFAISSKLKQEFEKNFARSNTDWTIQREQSKVEYPISVIWKFNRKLIGPNTTLVTLKSTIPNTTIFQLFVFSIFRLAKSQNREFTSFSVIEADTLMILMKVIANMIANAKLEKFSNRNQSVSRIIVNALSYFKNLKCLPKVHQIFSHLVDIHLLQPDSVLLSPWLIRVQYSCES